ncbi:hypothetical protein HanIR_Chr12g0607001 [Helianthus annuus]|nr:hypothetical protein HanIR_Chr12g0607001 [Helianthus annuus]
MDSFSISRKYLAGLLVITVVMMASHEACHISDIEDCPLDDNTPPSKLCCGELRVACFCYYYDMYHQYVTRIYDACKKDIGGISCA